MRCAFGVACVLLLVRLPAAGEQNAQAVGAGGAGVRAPVLAPASVAVSTPKHCDELDGVVKLAATIDADGAARGLKTLDASDRRLVGFATELVEAQRFVPGAMDGSPTAMAVELTVGLHTCAVREKHPTGDEFYRFTLRAHPLIVLDLAAGAAVLEKASAVHTETAAPEQVGGRVSAPIPTTLTDPKIPISRKFPKRGLCFLGVVIDANGAPQGIHVVRGLEPELDSNAMEAVKSWRFKPALRDGATPVAVEGTAVAVYGYVEKEPVSFATFIPETPEKVLAANGRSKRLRVALEPVNADEVVARYMPESRVGGRVLVSLVVDTDGVPQNVHAIKGLDSSLDMETVAMVEHLRFKPVMNDGGVAVPFGLVMPVRYRVVREKPTWRDLFIESLALTIFFL